MDYLRFEAELQRLDVILQRSGAETLFVERSLDQWLARGGERVPTAREPEKFQRSSRQALRCVVLQRILGEGYRGMSRRLAECPLFQSFCLVDRLEEVRVPSKSQLARYAEWLPAAQLEAVVNRLLQAAAGTDPVSGENPSGLANAIELDTVWMDTTCVEANIDFPVDWVLLRDATRTLMKATALIRRHGLKCRMRDPEAFLREMNQRCIAMAQAGKVADSQRARKRVLRQMKGLTRVVRGHARRHRGLLDAHWQETDWTRPQAEQVIARIDGVLAQLPQAVKQAHERIIGERAVPNADKILSLYDADLPVIVRGKAGAAVEFGNTFFIAEQAQGVVVDWHLYEESAPADSGQVPASLKRRRHGARFVRMQRRRSQTEGRIGILKNDFLGRPLRAQGYAHRALAVTWSVLAHNLWVLARLETAAEAAAARRKAA